MSFPSKRFSPLWLLGGFLLAVTGGGGIVWLSRYTWLPWLLRSLLGSYEIDKLRYEDLSWESPFRLTFYRFSLQKSSWTLSADTLTVHLWPSRTLHLAHASLEKLPNSPSEPDTSSSLLPPLPSLPRAFFLLPRLRAIDTLIVEKVSLPYGAFFSLKKHGREKPAFFLLEHPIGCIEGRAEIKDDSCVFSLLPTYLATQSGAWITWAEIVGHLTFQEDTLSVSLRTRELRGYHRRLASQPVRYNQAGFQLIWTENPESSSVSLVPLDLPLRGELHLHWKKEQPYINLQVAIPPQPHAAYLGAFPQGFFTCLSRAELGGTSAFSLSLTYDPKLPDTLELAIQWDPKDFQILRWEGTSPFTLREPFAYRPYLSHRTLWIGPENPNYLAFPHITPYVLHAVLHSEDGLFFYHQGFQKDHFLKALLENLRCRCFRRGAGTLTMQLVRNLLLTREKTFARKVEEILLTALIERFRLLSKQRMAELYFNIVEWGPEVYGLTEAAQYYFSKEPHDLTIPEAIFLGTLLPSPKAYRYFLEPETGCARASLQAHFRIVATYLVLQNYLPQDSVEAITPERVCLKGPAWRTDSLPLP